MSNAATATNQPQWELVYATDYSALYRDATGVYPPELCIAQTLDDVDEDDIEATAAVIYRFPLERCWQATRDDGSTFLCEQNPSREATLPYPLYSYKPWYADHLGAVANSCGRTVAELVSDLCSDDPTALASAFEDIGGHEGFDNFDQHPDEQTASQFADWPKRGPRLSTTERDQFTTAYFECAMWCGVMRYKHDDDCPCHEPSENGDVYSEDDCECEPDMTSDGDTADESQLADDARKQLTDDAHSFYADNVADLRASTLDMSQCGHDFWLTRNRHGAGFWDRKSRGAAADAALDRLTEASHACGEMTLIEGANTKIDVL